MVTPQILQQRVIELEKRLNLNDPTLQSVFHLSPACANLLGLLMNSDHVPLHLPPALKDLCIPRATVERLRKQLHPFGINVQVRRGLGYYMLPADKQEVATRLEQARTHMPPVTREAGERESACLRACDSISTADLNNPDLVLLSVPKGLAQAIRWLAEHPPGKK